MKASEAMNASNPIEPKAAEPKPASDAYPYEPSMEEILASIRRIIADDQSLPRAAEADRPEFALDEARPSVRIEPTLAPRAPSPPPPPDAAPLRAHLLRGETVELDFRAMAARQTGLASGRETTTGPTQTLAEAVSPTTPSDLDHAARSAADSPHTIPPLVLPETSASEDQPPSMPPVAVHANGMAHGMIAAPQYAGPGGPADHDGSERLATATPATSDQPTYEPSATPSEAPRASLDSIAQEHSVAGQHPVAEPHGHTSVALGHEAGQPLPADPLFSTATDTSVTAAFRTLAATRLADNSEELLDIAREMIRPLLKMWIDDNVPSMVERMVRAEIERVARGGR